MGVGVCVSSHDHEPHEEPQEEPPLLHLSRLEIREKALDRVFHRLLDCNGFHRCLAGVHLEHRVLDRHLLSVQEIM
jgi:hypothetical protein